MTRFTLALVCGLALGGCKEKSDGSTPSSSTKEAAQVTVTAPAICAALEAKKVAAGCTKATPEGASEFDPGGSAREIATFKLVSIPTQPGKVMVFANRGDYDKAIAGYDALKGLAVHTFGSPKRLVIVWLNTDATKDEAAAAKTVVDAL